MSTPRTVLLTLGRLPKALDLARAFAGAGWRVVVAEPARRHLTGASRAVSRSVQVIAPARAPDRYLEDLLQIVAEERVDLIVPVSEETMHVAALHGRLPVGTRLLTPAAAVVRRVYDKWEFVRTARAHGLAVPDTALVGDAIGTAMGTAMGLKAPQPADWRAIVEDGPYVVKPRFSCGGRGVQFFDAGVALAMPAASVVQAFVPGRLHSTCSLVHQGRCVGTVVYRAVLLSGTVAVAFEQVEQPAIDAWVERFAAAEQWNGFLSFDFILTEGGQAVAIECNPRVTSGIHFFDAFDLAAALVNPDSVRHLRKRPEPRLQQFWASLTEVQQAFRQHGWTAPFRQALRGLLATPDVSWRRDDPWPLIGMPYTAWDIITAARREQLSFGEVATRDLDWHP